MKNVLCFVPLRLWLSLVAAVSMSATTGCVAESEEDCGNVRLTVSIVAESDVTRTEIDGFGIECVQLYVFDTEGRYVTSAERGEVNGTGDEYEFRLTLSSGDYDFVVWTNMGEHYRVRQTVEELESDGFTMNDLELWLDHHNLPITDTIPHLLHGITHHRHILEEVDNHVEVEIIPKTYTVNLTALNLPRGDDPYTFTITDNNSHYTFEGDIIEDKPLFTHSRSGTAQEGKFDSSIRTLTLSADRHPRFSFTNAITGDVMYDADLIHTITRAYRAATSRAVDFSNTYTYDIVLTFDAVKMEFTVTVNGWEYDEQGKVLY